MNNNLPTTPGPYWLKEDGVEKWIPVYVKDASHVPGWELSVLFPESGSELDLQDIKGQWAKAHNPDEGMVLLPEHLTSENGAKYLLIGEFYEEFQNPYCCEDDPDEPETLKIPITWPTIKEIYAKIVKHYRKEKE